MQEATLVEKVTQVVSKGSGITKEAMLGSSRDHRISAARMDAMWLLYEGGLTQPRIAEIFGNRSRALVSRACLAVETDIANSDFRRAYLFALLKDCGIERGPKCPTCRRPIEEEKPASEAAA